MHALDVKQGLPHYDDWRLTHDGDLMVPVEWLPGTDVSVAYVRAVSKDRWRWYLCTRTPGTMISSPAATPFRRATLALKQELRKRLNAPEQE